MRPILVAAAALAGAVALPAAAMARPGFVTASLSLRAGPGIDFPAVDRIPAGARVNIHGCVARYRWCDVSFAGDRGWIDGDELQFLYRGRRVLIVDYGPQIDFPIIGFDVGTYWRHYYRGRDFYGRLGYWENRYQARGGTGRVGRHDDIEMNGTNAVRENAVSPRGERNSTVGRGFVEPRGMRGRRGAETTGAAPAGMTGRHGPETTGVAPRGAATTGAGAGASTRGGAVGHASGSIGGHATGGSAGAGAAVGGGKGDER